MYTLKIKSMYLSKKKKALILTNPLRSINKSLLIKINRKVNHLYFQCPHT